MLSSNRSRSSGSGRGGETAGERVDIVGKWINDTISNVTLHITQDGACSLCTGGKETSYGAYTLSGHTITFKWDSGAAANGRIYGDKIFLGDNVYFKS